MLIPNHPHDERLAALASADADAIDDAELTSHVAACARCTETVTDLGALRASLAELPDLRPSRPLRLLPGAEPEAASEPAGDRWTGWARRIFAPLATAGAALAMVGLIGTSMPVVTSVYQNVGDTLSEGGDAGAPAEENAGEAPAAGGDTTDGEAQPLATADGVGGVAAEGDREGEDTDSYAMESDGERAATDDHEALTALPAERSPWPMVLFAGVALVIGALLLRWIVVPRAG